MIQNEFDAVMSQNVEIYKFNECQNAWFATLF